MHLPALRFALLLSTLAPAAFAGAIQGIVVEHVSGRPLARARVKLEALFGNKPELVSALLSNRSGQFTFHSLPDGYYLLSAARPGFGAAAYGQKRSNAAGSLIAVSRESVLFAELRLKRLAAISGRVVDENQVGLPGVTVLAYTAAVPLRMAGSARSDDRGVYRIAGLTPGRYYVRSAAADLEDGSGLLPTFSPESAGTQDSRAAVAGWDGEALDVDLHPLPGRLHRIEGRILGCAGFALVTLSSDTGRQQARVGCPGKFGFQRLPPGDYELLAEGASAEGPSAAPVGAFQEVVVNRDMDTLALQLRSLPTVLVQVIGREGSRLEQAPVLARRKDLAGEGEVITVSDRSRLLPGFWELTAAPPASHYLESISCSPDLKRLSKAGQHPDWHEMLVGAGDFARIQVRLAARPASLRGRVALAGESSPVPGAPVFLWPASAETRRRVGGPKSAITDSQGVYRFAGLAPGPYLILSSFELAEITEEALTTARAPAVSLEEGKESVRDLALHQIQ